MRHGYEFVSSVALLFSSAPHKKISSLELPLSLFSSIYHVNQIFVDGLMYRKKVGHEVKAVSSDLE